jgi:hypothetical protein
VSNIEFDVNNAIDTVKMTGAVQSRWSSLIFKRERFCFCVCVRARTRVCSSSSTHPLTNSSLRPYSATVTRPNSLKLMRPTSAKVNHMFTQTGRQVFVHTHFIHIVSLLPFISPPPPHFLIGPPLPHPVPHANLC